MIQNIKERQNKRFEIQWYNEYGNNDHVTRCDTLEELAQVLSRAMWDSIRLQNNPTIYFNGIPFCFNEQTEITPEMYGNGKEGSFKIGDFVTVMADHPDGVYSLDTFGKVGMIVGEGNGDYFVRSKELGFWFADSQIRYATENEIKECVEVK